MEKLLSKRAVLQTICFSTLGNTRKTIASASGRSVSNFAYDFRESQDTIFVNHKICRVSDEKSLYITHEYVPDFQKRKKKKIRVAYIIQ